MRNLSTPTPNLVWGSRVIIISFFLLIPLFVQTTNLSSAGKIDINSAPLEDLIKIIHIGKARAEELISLRPFSSLDDLKRINGIGEARLEDIKKQGLVWVQSEETIETEKITENSLDKQETNKIVSQTEKDFKEELAMVSAQIPKKPSFLLLLIAFSLAILSGAIILLLKRMLKLKV